MYDGLLVVLRGPHLLVAVSLEEAVHHLGRHLEVVACVVKSYLLWPRRKSQPVELGLVPASQVPPRVGHSKWNKPFQLLLRQLWTPREIFPASARVSRIVGPSFLEQ